MKNIDFLPDIYRQKRHQRRAMRWWCVVGVVFAAAVLAAATSQWMIRRGIQHELAQVEPKYAEALQREAELAAVRQEIVQLEEVASLYAYLSHPWPRTQLLAGIIKPLPNSIRLTEVTMAFESLPQGPAVSPAAASARLSAGAKASPSPAKQDLTQLRNECDGRQVVLTVTGTATVQTELHAYVDQLGKSPLIAAAHLKSVESSGAGKTTGEARFHIHVVVRGGYGQRSGPPLDRAVPLHGQLSANNRIEDDAPRGLQP